MYTSRKQNAAEDPAARIPTNWFKVCSSVAVHLRQELTVYAFTARPQMPLLRGQ